MKIGVIVQRYGRNILGGAELHCRFIVDRLKAVHTVEVLTTCAQDYLTWQNEFEPGLSEQDGVLVRRFPVSRSRDVERYHHLSYVVSFCPHNRATELEWLEEQGPSCPDLLHYLQREEKRFDLFIFFSFRYASIYHGLALIAHKSILVPTAENDRIVYLSIFRDLFRLPAALAYNSIEEKELIQSVSDNNNVPGEIIGVGLSEAEPEYQDNLLRKFDLRRDYVVYVGRLEQVKGCVTLIDYYLRYCESHEADFDLVLVGRGDYEPPQYPTILQLTSVSESEKMGIISGAHCLINPSPYESLSMVVLEAWSVDKPVLVNGDCPVLRGQCIRSGGGLYYRNYDEFAEVLHRIRRDSHLKQVLGKQGNRYYREHYNWTTILQKYNRLFQTVLQRE